MSINAAIFEKYLLSNSVVFNKRAPEAGIIFGIQDLIAYETYIDFKIIFFDGGEGVIIVALNFFENDNPSNRQRILEYVNHLNTKTQIIKYYVLNDCVKAQISLVFNNNFDPHLVGNMLKHLFDGLRTELPNFRDSRYIL